MTAHAKMPNIGFVATRLAGTDGVSLETEKWAQVFQDQGFECFYFGGELDLPPEKCYLAPEAHFSHPGIKKIYDNCFGVNIRRRRITQLIHESKVRLKTHLYRFIRKFKIGLLIPENSLTIPLNIPLGVALTELISETGIPTIAHHHDFFWERERFMFNAIWEYLNMAFPPHLHSIQHVVINSSADNQLGLRTGISATVIPNVMDFDNPPAPPDAYSATVRRDLGIADDELMILQPTRVVQRKGIEHAIEFVKRLKRKATLVISHASGDEGYSYEQRLRGFSRMLGVKTIFVSDIINEKRGRTSDGRKIYTLDDVYPHADWVTYPSSIEGFGNAFLEAIYYKRPILVNAYSIYITDIKPRGFKVVEIDGYVSASAIRKVHELLDNSDLRQRQAEQNYEIARRCFSYTVLKQKLTPLLTDVFSTCPMGKRVDLDAVLKGY